MSVAVGPVGRTAEGSVALQAAMYCYPKTKTNMFVIESKDQAASFRVWSMASISP